jgi:transposase InsO family protein
MGTKILGSTNIRNGEYDDGRDQGNAKATCDVGGRESDTKKNDRYLHAKVSEKVGIIKELSAKYDVKRLCRIFGVPRSTYYAVLKREPSKRSVENGTLKKKILEIYSASKCRYGCIKIKYALKRYGIFVSQNRVLRLMRQLDIRSIVCKKYRKHSRETDNSDRPNLLKRRFYADKPNQVWLSDITYIKTQRSGWTYLAAVLDMCTRKVVGYSYSKYMTADLTVDALKKACRNQGFPKGLLFHSDQGSQYTANTFVYAAQTLNISLSYSARACPFDNAPMEAFNAILKKEEVFLNSYADFEEASINLFDFIEGWYNRNRIHSSIDFSSPVDFENLFVNF